MSEFMQKYMDSVGLQLTRYGIVRFSKRGGKAKLIKGIAEELANLDADDLLTVGTVVRGMHPKRPARKQSQKQEADIASHPTETDMKNLTQAKAGRLIRLAIDELLDMVSQVVAVEQGAIILRFNHTSLANVASQLKDAVFGR